MFPLNNLTIFIVSVAGNVTFKTNWNAFLVALLRTQVELTLLVFASKKICDIINLHYKGSIIQACEAIHNSGILCTLCCIHLGNYKKLIYHVAQDNCYCRGEETHTLILDLKYYLLLSNCQSFRYVS